MKKPTRIPSTPNANKPILQGKPTAQLDAESSDAAALFIAIEHAIEASTHVGFSFSRLLAKDQRTRQGDHSALADLLSARSELQEAFERMCTPPDPGSNLTSGSSAPRDEETIPMLVHIPGREPFERIHSISRRFGMNPKRFAGALAARGLDVVDSEMTPWLAAETESPIH